MPSTLIQSQPILVMLRVFLFGQKLRVCFFLDKYSNNFNFLWKRKPFVRIR